MNFRMANWDIQGFSDFTSSLTLKGRKSRWVMKLTTMAVDYYNENVVPNLTRLTEDYTIKDENGNKLYTDETKKYFKVDNLFFEEEKLLLEEEFILEINEINKKMLTTVAEVILDGDFDVPPKHSVDYVRWCEMFEEVLDNCNKIK